MVSDFQPPELETYVSVVYKPPSLCYNNPNKDASEIYFKKENFSSKQLHIFRVALVIKNAPAKAGDTRDVVRSLGQEDPLEEGMTTHSSILAWRILWTKEIGGL